MYNPRTILLLQKAAREGDYPAFKAYTSLVDTPDKPHTLRGLLDLRYDENGGIPIEEVEPVSSIVHRFKTGAMSYGSISQEAHECLAIAMNLSLIHISAGDALVGAVKAELHGGTSFFAPPRRGGGWGLSLIHI